MWLSPVIKDALQSSGIQCCGAGAIPKGRICPVKGGPVPKRTDQPSQLGVKIRHKMNLCNMRFINYINYYELILCVGTHKKVVHNLI